MKKKYINKINKLTKMFENKELSRSGYLLELAKLKEEEEKDLLNKILINN